MSEEHSMSLVSGVLIKPMAFRRGGMALTYKHPYDHQTILAVGKLRVLIAEKSFIYTAPTVILLKANTAYFLEGLADSTLIYCVHPVPGVDDLVQADAMVMGRSLAQSR